MRRRSPLFPTRPQRPEHIFFDGARVSQSSPAARRVGSGAMRWLAAGLVVALLTGCASIDEFAGGLFGRGGGPDNGGSGATVTPASLRGFDACEDLREYLVDAALEQVGPWGIVTESPQHRGVVDDGADVAVDASNEESADSGYAPALGVDGDVSGTNVQEAGVDEPDEVKISPDGAVLYVATGGQLRVLDVTGEVTAAHATLPLANGWEDAQLLLDGDRLLVTSSTMRPIGSTDPIAGSMPYGPSMATTEMMLVDVADPGQPEVLERLTVDGQTVSSRMVDGVVRVVTTTTQDNLPWVRPEGSGLRAERTARNANRDLVQNAPIEDWLPYFIHETAAGESTEGTLVSCDRVARPAQFAGLGMVSVLTVDLADDLVPGPEAVGVLAGGETVYASTEGLYVATARWVDTEQSRRTLERIADEMTTEIHAFDISDPTTTRYVASGSVPGTLLNQWAMSEHEGNLRVASTIGGGWWSGMGANGEPSSSLVTVLTIDDATLTPIGQVTGLGPTERIYAVRFFGDTGYVVTFRETDPLYTLDLSDPTDPRATGELKIMGYSAYLHPMGDDLLLGVGQDADETGFTLGTQVSLFDVADPSDPRRIDAFTVKGSYSDVEHDHRAFLHWTPTGLTVVPFTQWEDGAGLPGGVRNGALTFTVSREDGITPGRTLSHVPLAVPDVSDIPGASTGPVDANDPVSLQQRRLERGWQAGVTRTIVNGQRLLTVSDLGVATHRLDDLTDLGWYGYDQ